MIYLGTKTQTIVAASYTYNFDFTQTDFSSSAFYSLIQGGFTLFIDIVNRLNTPILIGIEITGDSGVVYLNDHAHIGFCAGLAHTIVSYASAPSLGNIRVPDVRKIRIIVYTFDWSVSLSTDSVSIALWVDNAREGIAAQDIIGKDKQAIDPFSYIVFGTNETSINNNTSSVLIADMTIGHNWVQRMLVCNIWLYAAITPYPADLRVYAQTSGSVYGASPIANVFSRSDQPAILNLTQNFYLLPGNFIEIRADNRNTTNDYIAGGLITATPIY